MHGGVSGIGQGPLVPQSTQIPEGSQTRQTDTRGQVEQRLGGQPTTPVTASVTARQTITTAPLTSLRGTVPAGVAATPARLAVARNRARAGLPEQIGITVPPGSSPVSLDSRMMAKEIQSLPRSQRSAAMANAGKTLQQRVNNGFKVYQQIQAGTVATPLLKKDLGKIRDLMTFLTARADQKTASFSSGSFNLPDPGNRIRNFLDSYTTEVYQRSSTHIEGFSHNPGCGHRGIDLKLPHGMGTLLYGAMKDGVMGTQGDRLFLKMESHGCRISTLSQDTAGEPVSRPKRFSDLLSALKHGWGGIKTILGLQKTEGTRKERVDKGVAKEFKALVQKAKESGVEGLEAALNQNNPAGKGTGYGVRTMMDNINNSLLKMDEFPSKARNLLGLSDLKAQLEAFKGELESRYDHIEHRIGNEIVLDMDELDGTGNAKEQNRDGQARSLVSQLMGMKDADALTTDTIKGLLTTMYALGSTLDGEGKDDQVAQKSSSLDKAITGLTTEQKAHLREILTSDKVQDLSNELQDRSMGRRLKMPGLTLSHQQEFNVRGLMADAMETLMFMTREVGAEPRLDGEYAESQVKGLTDTIFDLTESLARPKAQEAIHDYLSGVSIADRSALELQQRAGKGNRVMGTSAGAMFPDGPPSVDTKRVNAGARTRVEDILAHPRPAAQEGLAKDLGISRDFMADFKRSGVVVNGTRIGQTGSDVGQERIDQELQKFVDALGGAEQAVTASKLLFQATDTVSLDAHFTDTDPATGTTLSEGMLKVQMQGAGEDGRSIPTGSSRSITVNDDGSAVISLKHNLGGMDQVTCNSEVGIKLSALSGDVGVDDVQVAMIFTSND